MANAWWEPLTFDVQVSGPWRRVVDTSLPSPDDIVAEGVAIGDTYPVGPRSVVILER
jgi:glycogen operon protein